MEARVHDGPIRLASNESDLPYNTVTLLISEPYGTEPYGTEPYGTEPYGTEPCSDNVKS